MTSGNKTVNKAIDLLITRREKLRDKKQSLRDWVDENTLMKCMDAKA